MTLLIRILVSSSSVVGITRLMVLMALSFRVAELTRLLSRMSVHCWTAMPLLSSSARKRADFVRADCARGWGSAWLNFTA